MRGVSSLVALLIAIAIAVAAGAAVAMIAAGAARSSAPRGASLAVVGAEASLSGGALLVRVVVLPLGPEPVEVVGLRALASGEACEVSELRAPPRLRPGTPREIVALLRCDGASPGRPLTLVVEWRALRTNTTGAAVHTVVVR